MKKQILNLIATLGLMVLLSSATAFAQTLNMDMSWGINQQIRLQQQGDAAARNAAMAYYNYMLRLRQMGYTGPSLPTGVTTQSLQNSIQALQNSMNAYHQSSMANANRTYNAVNSWDYRAIRGCTLAVDVTGNQRWVCP